jgi:hypothetical protein
MPRKLTFNLIRQYPGWRKRRLAMERTRDGPGKVSPTGYHSRTGPTPPAAGQLPNQ